MWPFSETRCGLDLICGRLERRCFLGQFRGASQMATTGGYSPYSEKREMESRLDRRETITTPVTQHTAGSIDYLSRFGVAAIASFEVFEMPEDGFTVITIDSFVPCNLLHDAAA